MSSLALPEVHFLRPTPHCPNSQYPVLIYRNVIPEPQDETETSIFLQRYGWVKKGTWGAITIKHFHPNTHECYGVIQGKSELIFGEGGSDVPGTGVRRTVYKGDVVVIPAGVAHASAAPDSKDTPEGQMYRYIGVYPKDAPKWRNELGETRIIGSALGTEARNVVVPEDPVYGVSGPLVGLWNAARREKAML
ncbi:uncharacterized protein EKO05_0000004 [Ascochyta rabiei]|uniref:uncharacterized protein n=1 Tax=Didymella rabiei TaxID=5454 RepID=UPI0021FCF6A4|nr:uncharacterized protein EKO05_0000004 [Ascochyta rabiei]UPX09313.1 hypothetical protein EKO05_0000004 [Ascochyta rabiei]